MKFLVTALVRIAYVLFIYWAICFVANQYGKWSDHEILAFIAASIWILAPLPGQKND